VGVVAIQVEDAAAGGYTADRATVRQKKTGRPVRFELRADLVMKLEFVLLVKRSLKIMVIQSFPLSLS
jgi:hypothetical protein